MTEVLFRWGVKRAILPNEKRTVETILFVGET